jgi:hypothetical protein
MTADPTNAARQARHRKARALGYESIPAGYLPPRRARKVREWLLEADQDAYLSVVEPPEDDTNS